MFVNGNLMTRERCMALTVQATKQDIHDAGFVEQVMRRTLKYICHMRFSLRKITLFSNI